MGNADTTQRVKNRLVAPALAVGGMLLLLAGGLLLYPFVPSRVVPSPPALRTVGLTPVVSESEKSPVDTPTADRPFAFIPTLVPTPGPTPIPAIPDRIVISVIGLDAPVVPVTQTIIWAGGQEEPTFRIPQMRAVGWHETSAPLGVPGNTVLNGHNAGFGEVFRDLHQVKETDTILVYSGEASYLYAVTEVTILAEVGQPLEQRIENASYIQPTADERLTLVTCHPYGSVRNRLVVVARPAEAGE
jgi:LPXTG-site transpeptidase (sortase) family protein